MYIMSKNIIFKQTALFILCGLLNMVSYSQVRSKENIATIIENFCKTESFDQPVGDFKLKAKSSMLLRDDKFKNFDAFYLYTPMIEDGGFIIVSADKRMPAILAYSETGSFDVENIPSNVYFWLSCYAESYLALNGNEAIEVQTVENNTDEILPLLGNIKWGQDTPYNNLCPIKGRGKTLTGCVATGMAQVMKYYEHPVTATGKVEYITATNHFSINEDLSLVYFDWDNMRNTYGNSYSQIQANAVAQLMYSCGVSVKMDYNIDTEGGSGAYQYDVLPAYVENFGYDKDGAFLIREYCPTKDWHQIMIHELNEGRPINYAGQSSYSGGHSFVIDGYRKSNENTYPDYHVNWGWDGVCDGYYQIMDLTPGEDGLQGATDGFNLEHQMVIGVKPEDGIEEQMFYVAASNIKMSQLSVNAGNPLQLTIGSCVNLSYKSLDGHLDVYLVSTVDSIEYLVGNKIVKSMHYMQQHSDVGIQIDVPDTIPTGKYKMELRFWNTKSESYCNVLMKTRKTLNVSNLSDEKDESLYPYTLGCSELELKKNNDSLNVQVNLYEILNLEEENFTGYIKLILTDNSGSFISSLGDSVLLEELAYLEVQKEHKTLRGCFEGNLEDGEYRLYVGTCRMNENQYRHMALYDWTQPSSTPQKLFFDVRVENGLVYIEDKVYKITPSSNVFICIDKSIDSEIYSVYTVSGVFVGFLDIRDFANMPSGIYILRNKNEIRKIVR